MCASLFSVVARHNSTYSTVTATSVAVTVGKTTCVAPHATVAKLGLAKGGTKGVRSSTFQISSGELILPRSLDSYEAEYGSSCWSRSTVGISGYTR